MVPRQRDQNTNEKERERLKDRAALRTAFRIVTA